MGYYCSYCDSKFFIKKENISNVLETLVQSDLFKQSFSFQDKAIISGNSFPSKVDLLENFFHDQFYQLSFDGQGNVSDIIFEGEKWHDDTVFFDIIAKFVEKGSYIEMTGENDGHWRMIFDGKRCFEENAVVSWPEYDEVVNGVKAREVQAADFINKNPELARAIYKKLTWDYHREDVKAEIVQREDDFDFSDSDIDAITKNFEGILSKNDSYYESYWLSVGEAVGDFVREHTKNPALDDVISSCEYLSKGNKVGPDKKEVVSER